MYFIRYFLILVVIIYFPIVKADEQLMVVTSASPQSVQAKLTRYERSTNHHWHKVGKPVQVVVGKSGITKHKLEGDGATPAGKFSLGTAFGFAPKPDFALKLAYLPITE